HRADAGLTRSRCAADHHGTQRQVLLHRRSLLDLRTCRRDAMTKAEVIREIYRRVNAPSWAAANLDALADVLRDLSWLPEGPVELELPPLEDLDEDERRAVLLTLARAVDDSIESARPVRIRHAH